jgi:predicted enzyme related to lactoylglutathione lyase
MFKASTKVAFMMLALSVIASAQTANSQKEKVMFSGLQTVMIHVDDMQKAKQWYTDVLGVKSYFDEPFYIGFSVHGYELGIHPAQADVAKGGSTFVYWGTKDAKAELARLVKLGAKVHQDLQDVGGGILVATVTDPWGNILGVIQNPHFKLQEVK